MPVSITYACTVLAVVSDSNFSSSGSVALVAAVQTPRRIVLASRFEHLVLLHEADPLSAAIFFAFSSLIAAEKPWIEALNCLRTFTSYDDARLRWSPWSCGRTASR